MSLRAKTTNETNGVNAPCLSSNHKVMHYLQNSTRCSSTNTSNGNTLLVLQKTTSPSPPATTHDLFNEKDISINSNSTNSSQHRTRSCSDNGSTSSSSMLDRLSRSDFSLGSSLSDPGGHLSILSSNTSSSGICSTSSDPGHEEGTSTSSEDLDFNLGFDQISENDDNEIANLNEIDQDLECEQNDDENRPITKKNSGDTATLLDANESNLDERINELEEFLRKSYNSSYIDDDFNNDDTLTADPTKSCSTFLHDSTYTLCSQDRFSAYTESDDNENEDLSTRIGIRSNSLGIARVDRNAVLLDKTPKKVVRFADMLGLDLESIRYMTPPDQSTSSLIQECIRIKLEQLRFTKAQSSLSSTPIPSPFDLTAPNNCSPIRSTKQYYLVSKYFTPPADLLPRIYNQQIILECLYTKDSIAYGTVRVHNCAYDKRIFARITDNDWQTHQDIQAWHSFNYPTDNTDTFTFEIRLKKYTNDEHVPKQIFFAVCLQAMCQEFWDNNRGWNYVLDVLERR